MKNLLYHLTMLFNALGFVFSLSLVFYINIDNILFLPIIVISCFFFGLSFALTVMDFIRLNNSSKHKKHCYFNQNNKVIVDYKDYFITRKSDFIAN